MFSFKKNLAVVSLAALAITPALAACAGQAKDDHKGHEHSHSEKKPDGHNHGTEKKSDGHSHGSTNKKTDTHSHSNHSNHSNENGVLKVDDVHVGAAKKGGMAIVEGEFENKTGKDVTIVSASSDVSDVVELHDKNHNVVKGGFVIKNGESLELEHDDKHIMLKNLKTDLVKGNGHIHVSLNFSDGKTQVLHIEIEEAHHNH
ncbi:MAG: copper chaperone PCu(A)C [Microbacteriaceae bacterium]|nr:copper chaperone PCu(A)C [Microbacteriaceae bacterium]